MSIQLMLAQDMQIEEAIKQKKFKSEFVKADINLYFTSSYLVYHRNRALKKFGLSLQQFNILRILRGMKGKAATLKMIQERMIDKMSNASRLVEKLNQKSLVERHICANDRRKVDINITCKGLEVVEEASQVVDEETQKSFKGFSQKEAKTLNILLDKIRIL